MTKGICSLSQSIAIQCNTLLLLWKTWNYNPSDKKKTLRNLCNSINKISAVYLWILISFEEKSTVSTKISLVHFLKIMKEWLCDAQCSVGQERYRNILFFTNMQYYHALGKVHMSAHSLDMSHPLGITTFHLYLQGSPCVKSFSDHRRRFGGQ